MNAAPRPSDAARTPGADAVVPRERRLWRLALILTRGDHPLAAELALRAAARIRPGAVDLARLDRAVIQACRELPRAGPARPRGAAADAAPLLVRAGALPRQAFEAWALRRVEELDERHAARAMDCSRTALRLHLARAETLLGAEGTAPTEAELAALRAWLDRQDPTIHLSGRRADLARRRRARVALAVLAGVAIALGIVFAVTAR
ncbi:MAG TPA: hypothetical protein VD963_06265 [Phycisphaerales bacterium]|nr:hypothetical protein [Phycisphaerales bacterium]